MSGERPISSRPSAGRASKLPSSATTNIPYGYVRADEAGGSRGNRQPPSSHLSRPTQPTPNQSAPAAGTPPAASNQGNQAPQPQQQPQQPCGRVVMTSRVPDYYPATGDYAKHAALMANGASMMVAVEEEAVAALAPQQMYKQDVEAAKILQRMSQADREQYRMNGGS